MNDLHGKHFVMIINPHSGSAAGAEQMAQLARALRQAGATLRVEITQSGEHAQHLLAQARSQAVEAIIIVGGDGTVRPALASLEGSSIPVLVIPGGTENLLATHYRLNGRCDQAMRLLRANHTINMDLGTVNKSWFMAIMGVGFDAEVIDRVVRTRQGHINHTDYIWPICRTFWEYRFPRFVVIADGVERCHGAALVFVSNIPRYAMGLAIAPQADATNRQLDLTIFHVKNHLDLLGHTAATVLNKPLKKATTYRGKCTRLRIESLDGDPPCQVDGDPGPTGPWEINVRPAAVKLLVPGVPVRVTKDTPDNGCE